MFTFIDNNTADIKIDDLQTGIKLLHISDLHLTLYDETDSQKAIAEEMQQSIIFDSETFDNISRDKRIISFFKYAFDYGCDALLMTGDIINAPTNANLKFLKKIVQSSEIESIFCLGNHDWTFADDYQSIAQRNESIPKFADIFGSETNCWNPYYNIKKYDGFVLIAADNSTDNVPGELINLLQYYKRQNIPVILALHVPITVESMVFDVAAKWGRDICMGSISTAPDINSLKFVEYLKSENSPVKAIIAGHVHINHVDKISDKNDTIQYTLGASYQGYSRIINIHG